jgi:hypothetical protein
LQIVRLKGKFTIFGKIFVFAKIGKGIFFQVCQTGRVWGSWPAKESGQSLKKRMNNNTDVV